MAPSPKRIEEGSLEVRASTPTASKLHEPKKINCFTMERPPKPGMIPVSTTQVKGGCFVLAWQPQQVTLLVTEAPQWYSYAGQILKANLAFTAVFGFALLVVLVITRAGR